MESAPSSFDTLELSDVLLHTLSRSNYTRPTPIQEQAIPAILAGKDVLGIAKTGSGKTASYALPILQRLHTGELAAQDRRPPVLVLVPTRELAIQVESVFQELGAALPRKVKTMAAFGGVSINPQMIGMQNVQVLVATPGRSLDLIDQRAVDLGSLRLLILDEADKMLDQGFQDQMDALLQMMPRKRQNLLFSATLNKEVEAITQLVLHQPLVIHIEEVEHDITLIEQRAFRVAEGRKGPFLRYLIKTMEMHQVLVFTSSSHSADHVAEKLRNNGIEAEAIHGKKSNKARQDALQAFKIGDLRVLVATDLLARGIDIEFLPYVINYELPRSPKDHIHRIGRTGRAGRQGEAFTLVTPGEQHHFKIIQKKMGRWLTLEGTEDVDLKGF
jgi:ATP-dependent RNA helicase RhlE